MKEKWQWWLVVSGDTTRMCKAFTASSACAKCFNTQIGLAFALGTRKREAVRKAQALYRKLVGR